MIRMHVTYDKYVQKVVHYMTVSLFVCVQNNIMAVLEIKFHLENSQILVR